MIRRALGVGLLAALLATSAAAAAVPDGPRLAVIRASAEFRGLELATIGPRGGRPLGLVRNTSSRSRPFLNLFSPISWSSDGTRVAFSGIVGFHDGDGSEPIQKLFTIAADGSDRRPIPGTKGAAAPVFSPDGRTVAFTRSAEDFAPAVVGDDRWEDSRASAIWTVDLLTGVRRQLTPWRSGLEYVASSFSPDGSTLLATVDDDRLLLEAQPVALRLDGSGMTRLLDDGESPVYSPDGSKIALVRRIEEYGRNRGENLDLFVANADGSGLRRLTRTPERPELWPSWDPSGKRIAYVRLPLKREEGAPFGYSNALMQINADGTCPTKTPSARALFFVPSWQPGPGRGAGRIEC